VKLTDSTTVTANTANTSTNTISYVVVTFASGALKSNVQQFSVTKSTGTSNTQTITTVTAANTMIAWGGNRNNTGGVNVFTCIPYIALTDGSTVTLTSNSTAAFTCNFTIIEFISGVLKSAQRGSVAISASTSGTATPGTAVTAANSVCAFMGETGAGTTDATTNTRITLTNGTPTITANVTTSSSPTAGYELIEFNVISGGPVYYQRFAAGM
jgi:hypothetical protein